MVDRQQEMNDTTQAAAGATLPDNTLGAPIGEIAGAAADDALESGASQTDALPAQDTGTTPETDASQANEANQDADAIANTTTGSGLMGNATD
jgi:hypothetical protein